MFDRKDKTPKQKESDIANTPTIDDVVGRAELFDALSSRVDKVAEVLVAKV